MRAVQALPGRRPGRLSARDQAVRQRRLAGTLTGGFVDPALYRERIAGSFPGRLGVDVVRIEPDEVEGRLEVDERHLHPGGYVHGGVWVTLGDTVAAWGTIRNLPPGMDFTTVELKANVFAAARTGDVLTAIGRPQHRGRRTQVWEVRISRGDRYAALFLCTQILLTPGG